MKQYATCIILALTTLPGCDTKEKKEPSMETKPVKSKPLIEYKESPDDTTLPSQPKSRTAFLDEKNNLLESEVNK